MLNFLFTNLRKGFERLRDNPQLVYTVLVAAAIMIAFLFITARFSNIARDAQERLINVRVGSIQDAFTEFAGLYFEKPEVLNGAIQNIITANETVRVFHVVKFGEGNVPPRIIASSDPNAVGQDDTLHDFLFGLAKNDPAHSFTQAGQRIEGRFFRTVRAVKDEEERVVGVLYTEETLSEADRLIESNIRTSLALFSGIIALIMLLFFRHARIIDYTVLYRKLKDIDRLKDDFISMASHELRTPLTGIRGYAELATEEKDPTLKTKYISSISRASKDLETLVSDMLDVSRIEQGRMKFDIAPTSLTEAVQELTDQFNFLAKERGLAFVVEAPASAPKIAADPARLRQIATNLIGNAVKYTQKGEVKVRVYAENNRVFLRVSDTGFGIPAEDQKKLFEKFYRATGESTKGITGTGLGLWITKQLVEKMGGTISIESISGVGTHAIVSFPVAK